MTEKQRSALLLAASSEHILTCDSDPMFGVHPRTIRALIKKEWITSHPLQTGTELDTLSNRQLEDLDYNITNSGWTALGLNPTPAPAAITGKAEELLLNVVQMMTPDLEFYSRMNSDLPPICIEENHFGDSTWLDLDSVLLVTRYNRFDQDLLVEMQIAADITALQMGIDPECSVISVDRIGSWVVISDGEIETGTLESEDFGEDFQSEEEADY